MAAQTERIVLKEILVEDSDQFLKPEIGAKSEAIQNEREETGRTQTRGSLNKPQLSSTDGSNGMSNKGSYPHDLGNGLSFCPSDSKRNRDDNKGSSDFPEATVGKPLNPFGLQRMKAATVILHRVKDPRQNLSKVEGISRSLTIGNTCKTADIAEKHLEMTLELINGNSEEESKLAIDANSQECSMNITRSSNLDSLEISVSSHKNSTAFLDLSNLEDNGKPQTYQGRSNVSSNLNGLTEIEVNMNNQHLTEDQAIIGNLEDAAMTNCIEPSSDRSVTLNNPKDFTLSVSPSSLSSYLEAELRPLRSSEINDPPTPVFTSICPDDMRKETEARDGNMDIDGEVLLNYSRLSDFEACSWLSGLEFGDDMMDKKEMDDPRNSKKKVKRLLKDNRDKPRCPKAPSDNGSMKKMRNCTRHSPRLNTISSIRKESELLDAVDCSKEEIEAGTGTEISVSKGVLREREEDIKAQTEDRVTLEDQFKLENEMFTDAVCRRKSLRSRRSSVIEDIRATCAKPDVEKSKALALEESNAEIQSVDLSLKEEIKCQLKYSVQKTDKKLKMKRPSLLRCDWLVGDLLWAKMAGHPWWPCMLTYDPSLGLCTRSLTVGRVVQARYHVRFFGEKPYRAWIANGAILPYKGVEAFKLLCAQMLKTTTVHRLQNYYTVKDSRRRAWDAAVEETERINGMSRKDRLLACIPVSSLDLSKKSSAMADNAGRLRKERRKSMSSEKLMPECKRRRSESVVKKKSRSKDPRSPDDSRKSKDAMEDKDGNCSKEESKPEALKLCGSTGAGCGIRKGNVCLTCEQEVSEEELVSCEGSCLGSFHSMCLGLAVGLPTSFVCDECTTGSHTCFVCKVMGVETVRCSVSLCGRFYHLECMKKLRLAHSDKGRLQCPLHTCATCAADDIKNPLASKGSLLRCVRCPTAYHSSDFCLTAGSERLAGNAIVCSQHRLKTASQQHVNVNWCFWCSKGGTLLCCESCPAAFHLDCLQITAPPAGNWECEECVDGKRPLYGEIVWAKLGNYRWWPGEIYHPRNIPDSLFNASHQTGEFPVRFFGTHNYFWANIGRVFLFQEDDKGSKDYVRNGLNKSFSRAVQEANAAIRVWMAEKVRRDERSKAKVDRKPPPYKHLKASSAVGNVSVHRFNLDDIHPCSCHLDMFDPCGPESKCLNRDLSYECHASVCPVGDRCQNRRFQQREYVSVVPFKTESRGWGLKTLVDVKEGQFVIEYVGELIDHDECKRRMKEMQSRKNSSFYLLTLDKDRIIDAGPRGNVSRFMNHSCQPNCETQKWTVNGDSRIGLFSIVDIPAGSELTFNYNLDCLGNEKLACHCGSSICSGYLGLRPKQSTATLTELSKKKKKRRVKRSIHENECFRCGKTGQLIMCDKTKCPKVYHVKCLHLTKAPHGKWICPWHHCDECGQPSTKLCNECDNSFCSEHADGNITEPILGYLVCSEHKERKPRSLVETTRLCPEDNSSNEFTLSGTEGCDVEMKKPVEGSEEGSDKNSGTKRNWRKSSLGVCEKNESDKCKRKRKSESSTDALIKSDSGTKWKKRRLSSDILNYSEDGLNLSRSGKKALIKDPSCERKQSGKESSSTVAKRYTSKKRQKSLPESQIQGEDMVECCGTESGTTPKPSLKCNSSRRKAIYVININRAAKLKRKVKEYSGKVNMKKERKEPLGEAKLKRKVKEYSGSVTMKKSGKEQSGEAKLKRKIKEYSGKVNMKKKMEESSGETKLKRKVKESSEKNKLKRKIKENSGEAKMKRKIKASLAEAKFERKNKKPGEVKLQRKMKETLGEVKHKRKIEESSEEVKLKRKIKEETKLIRKVKESSGGAKQKRKLEESSGDLFTFDPFENEGVAKFSTVSTDEGSKKIKRNYRKSSSTAIPAKAECTLGRDHLEVTENSMDPEVKSTKKSKKKSLQFKDTEAVANSREVSKKTVRGIRASKKESRLLKNGLTLDSSVVFEKASVTLKKKLTRPKRSKISETERHDDALKSFGRKSKRGKEQKSRKCRRYMKQSDNIYDRIVEIEDKTLAELSDVAQIEIEPTEIRSLNPHISTELLLGIPVEQAVEITCVSEKEVTLLELIDEQSMIEEDSAILNVQNETINSPVKLTKRKVVKRKEESFGSAEIVIQSVEDKTGSQTERRNLDVNNREMESQAKIQDQEVKCHSGLQMEAIEIEFGLQKDPVNPRVKRSGLRSEKETSKNLGNISPRDLQKQAAIVKLLDDSKRQTEGIVPETTKNVDSSSDSPVTDTCHSKFRTDLYDTPSDSSESDVVFVQDGDFAGVTDDCKVWGKEAEQNDSEITLETNSNEVERNCHMVSADAGCSIQLDKKREGRAYGGKFPPISEDAGMNAAIIDEAKLVEVLLPVESVGKMTNLKYEAKNVASFGADGSSEMRTLPILADDSGSGFGVDSVREELGRKRNHKTSLGNTLSKSKDGTLRDCELFPRTY